MNSSASPANGQGRNGVLRRNPIWEPPEINFWKVNVDAALFQSPPSTGIGAVCRNWEGKVLGAAALHFEVDFPEPLAELRAILEGVILARRLGGVKIIVEFDCSRAVQLASRISESWSEVGTLVEAIWTQAKVFDDFSFRFIPREKNHVADNIAKKAKELGLSGFWDQNIPVWLCNLVNIDLASIAPVA